MRKRLKDRKKTTIKAQVKINTQKHLTTQMAFCSTMLLKMCLTNQLIFQTQGFLRIVRTVEMATMPGTNLLETTLVLKLLSEEKTTRKNKKTMNKRETTLFQ